MLSKCLVIHFALSSSVRCELFRIFQRNVQMCFPHTHTHPTLILPRHLQRYSFMRFLILKCEAAARVTSVRIQIQKSEYTHFICRVNAFIFLFIYLYGTHYFYFILFLSRWLWNTLFGSHHSSRRQIIYTLGDTISLFVL